MARVRMEIPQGGGTSDLHCPSTTKLLVSSAPTGAPPTSLRISAALTHAPLPATVACGKMVHPSRTSGENPRREPQKGHQ